MSSRNRKIDFDKAKTEKVGAICLKIIDSFLQKNIATINEEFLGIYSDSKKYSEGKFFDGFYKLKNTIMKAQYLQKFILRHTRSQIIRNMNEIQIRPQSKLEYVTQDMTHQQITEDLSVNPKGKFGFLLRYDG